MSNSARIKVGDWIVTPALNLLERGDESVRIEPRTMDVLEYLARHPGRVVPVDELMDTVWQEVVVSDRSAYLAISQLRQALGDSEPPYRYIETIRKRGYRLTARVALIGDAADSGLADGLPASESRSVIRKNWIRPGLWAGAVLVIALSGIVAFSLLSDETSTTLSSGSPLVAVLPCDNLSPDPDDAFFAAGIHEELLNRLAQLSGIRVSARSAVLRYAEARPLLHEIAADLNASAILECSVRYANDNVLVTAQLIDPATETHLWSGSYDGDRGDLEQLFALQADIAGNIARALDVKLSPSEARRAWRPSTDSMEAYAHILKLFEDYRRFAPIETLFGHVERAIAADPEFAFAYAARGTLRNMIAFEGPVIGTLREIEPELLDSELQLALARDDAMRALEIDPELGFAYSVLAGVSRATGNFEAARITAERALELNPSDPLSLRSLAITYAIENRVDEALVLAEEARRLDPNLAEPMIYAIAGDIEQARELAQSLAERIPLGPSAHVILALIEGTLFDNAETAERELRLAEELAGENAVAFHLLMDFLVVYGYSRIGLEADANRVYQRVLDSLPDSQTVPPPANMLASLAFGDIDQAYESAVQMTGPSAPVDSLPTIILIHNALDDPSLERPEFVELRRKLLDRR